MEFEALWKEKGYIETTVQMCDGLDTRGRILGEGFARGNGVETPTVEQLPDGGARYVAPGYREDLLTIDLEELVGVGEYAEASGTFYVDTAASPAPANYQTFCFEGILKRIELKTGTTCNLLISRTFGSTADAACVGGAGDYLSAMLTEKPLAVP
jgi:hypothetical protein